MTNTGQEMVKIKGFTLNYKNKRLYLKLQNSTYLNLESMKRILEKEIDKVTLSYKTITRNVKNKTLFNTETSKEFNVDKKNQLDVTFCILYFSSNSCSTCFGQPCAHHQELTTA